MTTVVLCVNCGAPLDGEDVFCINCGVRRSEERLRGASGDKAKPSERGYYLPLILVIIAALMWGIFKLQQPSSPPRQSQAVPAGVQRPESPPKGQPSQAPPTALVAPYGEYTGER